MTLIRFAIVSDLHIALPHTVWNHPNRFHLVEVSIPALEAVLSRLEQLNLDFILLPGDLTQHGEPENHWWLSKRLKLLPFPAFVIPGNHDVPSLLPTESSIGLKDFPYYYEQLGYENPQQLYYTCELLPGVQLVALNSNQFDAQGNQLGCLDKEQLNWLDSTLSEVREKLVLVMIHHNVVEHLPGQSHHQLGQRYMLDNAPQLLQMLKKHSVKLIFTGHLHIQDIAETEGIYEVTTGSLVSFPHPYRILELQIDKQGKGQLSIESYKVESVPGWENLHDYSREWMGDRSFPFMSRLLAGHPLNLPPAQVEAIAPKLRYFWADIAAGDAVFDFSELPALIRHHLQQFGALNSEGTPSLIDNRATIEI